MTDSASQIESELLAFIESKTKTPVEPDVDLFSSGMFSSLFAMELVAQIEQSYDVMIFGPDLAMDNFRTVRAMASLVGRLLVELAGAPAGSPVG